MQFSLRPASPDDLEPMMTIGHEGIRPYVEELFGWNQSEQELQFRKDFQPEVTSIIQIAGKDVGYLILEEQADHTFIAGIYIASKFRRYGLGSLVLKDVIKRSQTLGKSIRLRVLRPNPVRQLYTRFGFEIIDTSDTHVFMELRLP